MSPQAVNTRPAFSKRAAATKLPSRLHRAPEKGLRRKFAAIMDNISLAAYCHDIAPSRTRQTGLTTLRLAEPNAGGAACLGPQMDTLRTPRRATAMQHQARIVTRLAATIGSQKSSCQLRRINATSMSRLHAIDQLVMPRISSYDFHAKCSAQIPFQSPQRHVEEIRASCQIYLGS
jgi:hypothetical protein